MRRGSAGLEQHAPLEQLDGFELSGPAGLILLGHLHEQEIRARLGRGRSCGNGQGHQKLQELDIVPTRQDGNHRARLR